MTKEEIKALRTKAGKTQLEMAYELDVQPVTVSRWERGECSPSKPYVKLMKAWGV